MRSLEVSEAKRGPPQQLSSWQSGYTKRLDPLGFFDSANSGGYSYPPELVRRSVDPSSEEDEPSWDPDREEDEAEDDDVEDASGDVDDEASDVGPPVVYHAQDLER